jgi:hypothetical protein
MDVLRRSVETERALTVIPSNMLFRLAFLALQRQYARIDPDVLRGVEND